MYELGNLEIVFS